MTNERNPKTVLIADDDPTSLLMLETLAAAFKLETVTATSVGEDAVGALLTLFRDTLSRTLFRATRNFGEPLTPWAIHPILSYSAVICDPI